MKKSIQSIVVLCLCLLFSGCVGYSVATNSYPFSNYGKQKSDFPAKGWKNLLIYDELDPEDNIEKIAKIVVTGNENSSESGLLKKLKREAGKFNADAILHVETREVPRTSVNGIAIAVNLISIFTNDDECEDTELDMGGDYYTLEVEGIAFRFLED